MRKVKNVDRLSPVCDKGEVIIKSGSCLSFFAVIIFGAKHECPRHGNSQILKNNLMKKIPKSLLKFMCKNNE